jgi:hypothetical protein
VADLASVGLWGIEAFSSEIDEANHNVIEGLAKAHNLVMTGGSDNHGHLKVGRDTYVCFVKRRGEMGDWIDD